MKKIAILGSTGYIGRQALEVVRAYPNDFKIIGLSANKNKKLLEEQIKEFKPLTTSIGGKNLEKIATHPDVDLVLVAVVGLAGLKPTLAAIKARKNIALTTKEVLVLAGELVMNEVKKNKINIIPVDSEHSAIFQCLKTGRKKEIKKIILTMGKGQFANMSQKELAKITLRDIYKHPTWIMGNKITIDSATCLNKSFEVIEAKWLFDLSSEAIEIMVHPEYLCHSLVEFIDGSNVAEFGTQDMRRYIQYALFYPNRKQAVITNSLNLFNKTITFEPPPFEKFPGLELGFDAIRAGGTMPAVMHGADDTAVEEFIKEKIKFTDIARVIKITMSDHQVIKKPDLEEILKANEWGKIRAKKLIEKKFI
ncbi:1-deoxy-D-xylulose-5-phosphate reductoisomerase [Candidatus Roizmanbacteria bacterium CG02_land_8_20_14_3_00_36_15]|uniref:1-deoxy-D-xylulose 5-phosphate reductoisomerase n=1 Tax=Candidatus Roizmanbacteria bacterium CG10_big_fil_rev_8_21_14_0_10_36_26 TaxID=1974851 RepID=A0A2M8KLH4_9BACT|nr:MAG: 1-deoxy-D-xylulose-5-phosphate reductoisomerase [Candidatus Roizmanbacteria bacterium CG03_land_8_20_14_0_80_36_21]PIV37697.1 MAG: 1-deoxy-D-xylulose-5-phosphate reductoisomerase [Candidatus Roizmanbacteria bacterium CG02_land_8_20_14_3_00_36_15]PIY69654.1 MAG: 1-deoxy-D-xylulose-5-phosphate reductoisomerase [Candidatus Roizmanbacteria bacterium CG_4_10_14_0_8_um_filter_36_36]PJA53527.1 MAG: 1-deoxy-D-xylulose-5-phosphate reductoisomerase [Candidatus Roizmanbacteria bacterium CG_4_9_14_3